MNKHIFCILLISLFSNNLTFGALSYDSNDNSLENITATTQFWQSSLRDSMSSLIYWAQYNPFVNYMPIADDDEGSNTPLCNAAENNDDKMVNYIYGLGGSVYPVCREGNTALCLAVKNENSAMTNSLIEKGSIVDVSCDDDDTTPLCYSAKHNSTLIVQDLLNSGDQGISGKGYNNVNTTCNAGATCTSSSGYYKQKLGPPLCYATEYNNQNMTDEILQENPNVNVLCDYGTCDNPLYSTPLCYTAQNNNDESVQELISRGIEDTINYVCGSQQTALYWGAANNNIEIVEALGKAGANPNAAQNNNQYPILPAVCIYQDYDIALYLLNLGANPNVTAPYVGGKIGDTYECNSICCPLACAQDTENQEMIDLLTEYNASCSN